MTKIFFVLVIIALHGGVNTELKFNDLHHCEAVKKEIATDRTVKSVCIEMQKTKKEIKCRFNKKNYDIFGDINGARIRLKNIFTDSVNCEIYE